MKDKIKAWLDEKRFPIKSEAMLNLIYQCFTELQDIDSWVSVEDRLPECEFEYSEWDGDTCLFDGQVSNSYHITDGQNIGLGHYQDDGIWKVYEGEHDFMNIEPDQITHYKPIALPK